MQSDSESDSEPHGRRKGMIGVGKFLAAQRKVRAFRGASERHCRSVLKHAREFLAWISGGSTADLLAKLPCKLAEVQRERDAAEAVVSNLGKIYAAATTDPTERFNALVPAVGVYTREALRGDFGFAGLGKRGYSTAQKHVEAVGISTAEDRAGGRPLTDDATLEQAEAIWRSNSKPCDDKRYAPGSVTLTTTRSAIVRTIMERTGLKRSKAWQTMPAGIVEPPAFTDMIVPPL